MTATADSTCDIIIIGAGISGLACCKYLYENNPKLNIKILEGRDRIGGRIHTITLGNDFYIDCGASWIHGKNHPKEFKQVYKKALKLSAAEHDDYDVCVYTSNGVDISDEFEEVEEIYEACVDRVYKQSSSLSHVDKYNVLEEEKQKTFRHMLDANINKKLRKRHKKVKNNAQMLKRILHLNTTGLEGYLAIELDDASFKWCYDDEEDDETGGDFMVLGNGYRDLVNYIVKNNNINESILLNHEVIRIHRPTEPLSLSSLFRIHTKHGVEFTCKYLVLTVPLGVLKEPQTIEIIPSLPVKKLNAINGLGFGVLNKVVLRFRRVFWPNNVQWIGYAANMNDEKHQDEFHSICSNEFSWFLNLGLHTNNQSPILVAFVNNSFAKSLEQLSDLEVIKRALNILKIKFGSKQVDDEYIDGYVTRWFNDRYARGSYSSISVHGTGDYYDELAKALDNGRFGMAGEATYRKRPGTVAGAFMSGIREAKRLLNRHM